MLHTSAELSLRIVKAKRTAPLKPLQELPCGIACTAVPETAQKTQQCLEFDNFQTLAVRTSSLDFLYPCAGTKIYMLTTLRVGLQTVVAVTVLSYPILIHSYY
jgi:hypothetical protein